jgi:hypothetical protein
MTYEMEVADAGLVRVGVPARHSQRQDRVGRVGDGSLGTILLGAAQQAHERGFARERFELETISLLRITILAS